MKQAWCVLFGLLAVVSQGQLFGGQTYNCKVSVVGAGWGGAYFTYRTTLSNNAIYSVSDVCIFEQNPSRIGGRAYDYTNPLWEDLQVDLGAYRYENIQQLVPGVIHNILNLSTICYNGDCDPVQGTTIITDQYGNNGGYATAVRGLITLFTQAGGNLYMGHELINIVQSTQASKPMQLKFANGVTVNSAKVILNLPASAIAQLNSTSLLSTQSTQYSSLALNAAGDIQSVKQFIWYPDAWWLTKLNLTVGEYNLYDNKNPPIQSMRLGDGAIKCYTVDSRGHRHYASTRVPGGAATCYGALMSNYAEFDESAYDYYLNKILTPTELANGQTATFITNTDPATGIHARDHLLANTHARLLLAFNDSIVAAGIDPTTLALPTSTVVGLWNSAFNYTYPSWYDYMTDNMTGQLTPDTQYALRSLAIKPLPNFDLYVTNEAYSLRGGWAEGSLILVERVLAQYFGFSRPSYVSSLYYTNYVIPYLTLPSSAHQCNTNSDCSTPNNCVVGTCVSHSCVYNTRVNQNCSQCDFCYQNPTCSYSGQCYGPEVTCPGAKVCAGGDCVNKHSFTPPACNWSNADITFYWEFPAPNKITIAYTLQGVGYSALGLSSTSHPGSMVGADIWVASTLSDGTMQVKDYYTSVEGPPYLDTDLGGTDDLSNIFIQASASWGGPATVYFTRALNTGDAKDNVIVNGNNTFIYAWPSDDYTAGSVVYHGPNRNSFTVDLSTC